MAACRKSIYLTQRKTRAFTPDLQEWANACRMTAYNNQLCKHFDICESTLGNFFDREHCLQEADPTYISPYLLAYKEERRKTKDFIYESFLKNIGNGDTACIIFGLKSFNKLIEAKDHKHIQIKIKELELKSKQYLTDLALKFNLDYDQLSDFSKKYFDAKGT